ncbi:MAG: 2-oxoacid:ferredoxin oxidoreductase subunit beta [Prevotellaceae bacterium]|jgi:2-oxoglutarate ferredoxin oxidoreductase subunit beta|nr:2-oxoacid:ferredoxin oxidoreductase subunit beta [Prevotellaceae bacterium]
MLTQQDFKTDQEVRWCPGCGDHAVLAALQRVLPVVAEKLHYNKEDFAVVSGIGCSSRLPYYVNAYGFHGIHGRATAISTGVKAANPKISTWQITGDGDALAIGGNHFIHAIRRNIDINILLFNNEIYGLTKGQYSPTSKFGSVTKTSPYGTIERPFNPGELVIGARGTFFARTLDGDLKLTQECLLEEALHNGTSVTEMLLNCVIFNDGTHSHFAGRDARAEKTIVLRHGEPMIFGANRDKGLALDDMKLKVVNLGENGITDKDLLVHDATEPDTAIHMLLAAMKSPDFPVALGIIRKVQDAEYNQKVQEQANEVFAKRKITTITELLNSGETWEVK